MVIEYCTTLVTCLMNFSFFQHFIATKKLLFCVHQYTYITLDTMCKYVIFFSEGQKCRMTRIPKICMECPKSVTWTLAAPQSYRIGGVSVWDSLFAPLLAIVENGWRLALELVCYMLFLTFLAILCLKYDILQWVWLIGTHKL